MIQIRRHYLKIDNMIKTEEQQNLKPLQEEHSSSNQDLSQPHDSVARSRFISFLFAHPNDGEVCLSLGMSFYNNHDIRKAKYYLFKAFRLLPHLSGPCYNLGKLYYEERQYPDAIRFL